MIKNVNLKNDKYIANLITEELKKSDVIDMFKDNKDFQKKASNF